MYVVDIVLSAALAASDNIAVVESTVEHTSYYDFVLRK